MELVDAIEVVRTLAQGIDPKTGQPFPKDSPYNQPVVIRALFTVAQHFPRRKKTLEEKQQENIAKGLPRNTGLPWTEAARTTVATSYRQGKSIEQLAGAEERSKSAILAELKRQGVITQEEAERLGMFTRERPIAS